MRILKVLFVVVLFASLFAVAEEPASTAVDSSQSKATLYVYRYKQFVGKALSPSVYCDESELAHMVNGRYFSVKLDPGKHSLRSNDKQSGIDLDMKGGQSYFIRVEIAAGFMKGHGRLVLAAAEQAGYELKQLKPLDQDKVVDTARVSVAEAKIDVPAAAPTPAEQPKPAATPEPAASGASGNSKATLTPVSETSGEVSLGEAARQAKQKKQNPPQQ